MLFWILSTAASSLLTGEINGQSTDGDTLAAMITKLALDTDITSITISSGDFNFDQNPVQTYDKLKTFDVSIGSFRGAIPNSIFSGLSNIESITIDGATSVGTSCFSNCIRLMNISLNSCQTFGDSAFSGCSVIETISLPSAITIGQSVFQGCSSLEEALLPKVENIANRNAFYSCSSLNYICLSSINSIGSNFFQDISSLKQIDLDSSASFGQYAFKGCSALETVNAPELISIDLLCFQDCGSLRNISFPKLVTLGSQSFLNCGLTEVYLPLCATIGHRAFSYCKLLTEIRLESANTFPTTYYESDYNGMQFDYCTSLLKITFDVASVTSRRMFRGCTALKEIEMPNMKTIDDYTFTGCTSLNIVSLPSLTKINNYGFTGCTGITEFYAEHLSIINEGGFYTCSNLRNISFPFCSSVTSYAFQNNYLLRQIYLPNVSFIGFAAFRNCRSLVSADFDSAQTYNTLYENSEYRNRAFQGCTLLEKITFAATTYLPEYMFEGVTSLIEVSAPNLTTVGIGTFYGCSNLKTVDFLKLLVVNSHGFNRCESLEFSFPKLTNANAGSFYNCLGMTTLSLPSLKSCGESAFKSMKNVKSVDFPVADSIGNYGLMECTSLISVSMPKVTYLGGSAFRSCTLLEEITLESANSFGTIYESSEYRGRQFYDCKALKRVSLPVTINFQDFMFENVNSLEIIDAPNIKTIPRYCFYGCKNLQDPNFTELNNVGEYGFFGCSSFRTIRFEELVTADKYSFSKCNSATSIDFPIATTIQQGAFELMTNLVDVNLPKVSYLGAFSFNGCGQLREIELPSLTSLGTLYISSEYRGRQFASCDMLEKVVLPILETVIRYMFQSNTNMKICEIPKLKKVEQAGFYDCTGLTELNFPKLQNIDNYGFQSCKGVFEISFPLLTTAGSYAFHGMSSLENCSLPLLKNVGTYGFASCISLVEVTLENAVSIQGSCFRDCAKLETVHLPLANDFSTVYESSEHRGRQFYNCPKLSYVYLPEATYIQNYMFEYNTIVEIHAPKITSIGQGGFVGCSNVKRFNFPLLITANSYSFQYCSSVSTFALLELTSAGSYSFQSCSSLVEVQFPKLTSISEGGFYNCILLSKVEIPLASTIGAKAFMSCSKITELHLPSATQFYTIYQSSYYRGNQFNGCSLLETLVIDSVVTLPGFVFDGTTLKKLILPKLQNIDINTFYNVKNLQEFEAGLTSFTIATINNPSALKRLTLTQLTTLKENSLKDQTQLEYLSLPRVEEMKDSALMGCSALTQVELPFLKKLVGDNHFSGCSQLQSISMITLDTVDKTSSNIFYNCRLLKEITLGPVPPNAFNPSVFMNRNTDSNITLNLPNGGISTYDKSTLVEGDVAGDGYWCGIPLDGMYISVIANEIEGSGSDVFEAVTSTNVNPGDLTTLVISTGSHSHQDLQKIKSSYTKLSKLTISGSARIEKSTVPEEFMKDSLTLTSVVIRCPVALIGVSAFEGCSLLSEVIIPTALCISGRCFYGIAAASIIFDSLTEINGNDMFSSCSKLKTLSFPLLSTVDSSTSICTNCELLEEVVLPDTPPTILGTFNFANSAKASLKSNEIYMIYDVADGDMRNGMFYSLKLDYYMITLNADTTECRGLNIANAIERSSLSMTTVQKIEVTGGVLSSSDFPLVASSLTTFLVDPVVSFSSIPQNSFANLQNLETVNIKGTREFSLGDSSFSGCTSLKTVVLTGLTALVGDSFFKDCVSLASVSMPNLVSADKPPNIFYSCSSLKTITLGSTPPSTFHRDTFKRLGSTHDVTLLLPNEIDYETYDYSLKVSGDVAGDSYWCGLYLPMNYFNVIINGIEYTGTDLANVVSQAGIDSNIVTTIEIIGGVLRIADISNLKNDFTALSSFSSNYLVNVVGDLDSMPFSSSTVRRVSIDNLKNIKSNAFSNCLFLEEITLSSAIQLDESAFEGCGNLISADLRSVTTLTGDSHFKNCKKIELVNLKSLNFVDPTKSGIFSNCGSFKLVFPPKPPLTFHESTFLGLDVVLSLDQHDQYKVYDDSTSVANDVAGDYKWCSIDLIQLYMTVEMNNLNPTSANTFEGIASANGIESKDVFSIEVQKGMVLTSELSSISSRFPKITTFIIGSDASLENSEIPDSAFINAASLRAVEIRIKASLSRSVFENCVALSTVTFAIVPYVSDRSFHGCSNIIRLVLYGCERLIGDSIFEGCSKLEAISLNSLLKVDPTAESVFKSCTALKTISLPRIPPRTFCQNSFADSVSIELVLPDADSYLRYDQNTEIVGDVSGDNTWCGIRIPESKFPSLLVFEINNVEKKARTLKNAISDRTNILNVVLKQGVVESEDLVESMSVLKDLKTFKSLKGTLGPIPNNAFAGSTTITEILIEGNHEIKRGAFSNMIALQKLTMGDQETIGSDDLKGSNSIKEIDLRSLKVIQTSTFENLEVLETLILTNAITVYPNAFKNCMAIVEINIPRVIELIGDEQFSGCTNLERVYLSRLAYVDDSCANIFANCPKMSMISLANSPPERFNKDVFKNRNSDLEMTLNLPSEVSWKYYEPQSSFENGRYYWYGIPHPTFIPDVVPSSEEGQTTNVYQSEYVNQESSEIKVASSSLIEHDSSTIEIISSEEVATSIEQEEVATSIEQEEVATSIEQEEIATSILQVDIATSVLQEEAATSERKEVESPIQKEEQIEKSNIGLIISTAVGFVLFAITLFVSIYLFLKLHRVSAESSMTSI